MFVFLIKYVILVSLKFFNDNYFVLSEKNVFFFSKFPPLWCRVYSNVLVMVVVVVLGGGERECEVKSPNVLRSLNVKFRR